jgi:signal peptidase I
MSRDKDRNPYAATFLSLLAPGLGHVYAGRVVEGLSLAAGTVAVGMLGTVAILATPSWVRVTLPGAGAAWAILWVSAAVGAFRCARAAPTPLAPSAHRRWYVCVVLVGLTMSSVAMWAVAVRDKVAQVFRVPSSSMEPTVPPGGRVLVDKITYQAGPVRRGDVVVFMNPDQRYRDYVKRIIALPGDTVEMRDDDVFVNGTKLIHVSSGPGEANDGAIEETNGDARYRIVLGTSRNRRSLDSFAAIKVPSGHCFLLGDNRHESVDSRQIGPVPLANIIGRVAHVL